MQRLQRLRERLQIRRAGKEVVLGEAHIFRREQIG